MLPGVDLLDHAAVTHRKHLFLENFTHDMLDVDQPAAGLRARSYVSKQWKLTVHRSPHPDLKIKKWQMAAPQETIQLFNLQEDPMERNNLAAQHPEKVSELKQVIDRWWNPEK
jgi:uncharacterized sulfatase